jgi:glycosyltransferase involved in cell wall biosynthesis
MADILHVPFTYAPDAAGGTEVYVAGLVEALSRLDVSCAVAAPSVNEAIYEHGSVAVYRFAGCTRATLGRAYGESDDAAAASFRTILDRVRPRIVHLHARSAAVSHLLVDAAHDTGAKVVFTYHTPTVSCVRGTMMWMGHEPCDGYLDVVRCAACTLAQHGVTGASGQFLARMPPIIGRGLRWGEASGGVFTALRMNDLVNRSHAHVRELLTKVDRIVSVCNWVAEVLKVNGVPAKKIVFSRQGLSSLTLVSPPEVRIADKTLRLAYFGRVEPAKGIDILIDAFRQIPGASIQLDVYGVRQANAQSYFNQLTSRAAKDGRITFQNACAPNEVIGIMRRYDMIAVPSRGLETGPLVVLEAFAARIPVIGTKLGGITELIKNEVDGILVPSIRPADWAEALAALAREADHLEHLRAGIRPPRLMGDVAADMAKLYHQLLDGTIC